MNRTGKEMLTYCTENLRSQRSLSIDGAALETEITTNVGALMEEEMSMLSRKLDIITTKLESNSQLLEEAESHISNAKKRNS